jgi:hypothetical protein
MKVWIIRITYEVYEKLAPIEYIKEDVLLTKNTGSHDLTAH